MTFYKALHDKRREASLWPRAKRSAATERLYAAEEVVQRADAPPDTLRWSDAGNGTMSHVL